MNAAKIIEELERLVGEARQLQTENLELQDRAEKAEARVAELEKVLANLHSGATDGASM